MTATRSPALDAFLTLTREAIARRVVTRSPAELAMQKVGAALASPCAIGHVPVPATRPATRHLQAAIAAVHQGPPDLGPLADATRTLAPQMVWRHRPSDDAVFTEGHANAAIVGPEADALEQRHDVRVGISLMAPGITYPDHRHPPEEVYIVLSPGQWRQGAGSWHEPGAGGIVYNPPDIVHAMRSSEHPLLAIWCLPVP
jgi:quercetin dioxygenase-like cupin family protein